MGRTVKIVLNNVASCQTTAMPGRQIF